MAAAKKRPREENSFEEALRDIANKLSVHLTKLIFFYEALSEVVDAESVIVLLTVNAIKKLFVNFCRVY